MGGGGVVTFGTLSSAGSEDYSGKVNFRLLQPTGEQKKQFSSKAELLLPQSRITDLESSCMDTFLLENGNFPSRLKVSFTRTSIQNREKVKYFKNNCSCL